MLRSLIFIIAIVLFGWAFKYTYQKELKEPNIDLELKQKATKDYLNSKIKEALANENIDDAKVYLNLAKYLKVPIDKELIAKIEKEDEPLESTLRGVKDFASGFVSGKSTNGASLGGSVVSDFTVVGDLRDVYKEGSKYLSGEKYNEFLLDISLIGLAITASTYISFGASAPVKTGEAILKSAYKSGKLTKGFIKILDSKLAKSVDLKLLKKVDFSSFGKMEKTTKAVLKSINPKPLKALLKTLGKIEKKTSISDTVKLLKYVKSEKDLSKVAKISSKYGKNTLGVFKVLGKNVLRAGKLVIKWTAKLLLNIAGFILSILGFLFSTIFYRSLVSNRG